MSAGATAPPARARPLAVIAIACGLGLLVATFAALARSNAGTIDAGAEIARLFEPPSWPFGLQLDHAVRLPSGEHVVVLVDPAAPPEPPGPPKQAEAPAPQSGQEPPRYDASKVVIGPVGPPPRRVVVISDPARAGLELTHGSTEPRANDVRRLGAGGGVVPIESGRLSWHAYDADFVHERHYEAGGTFRDSLRVNLSANGRSGLLLAEWTRGTPGSRAQAEALIAALVPRPKAGSADTGSAGG